MIIMDKTVLQIPISKALRTRAEKSALEAGFSSLQEVMRVFMKKLATGAIEISFQEVIKLSPRAGNRYQKMAKDFIVGRNVYSTGNLQEFKKQLSE